MEKRTLVAGEGKCKFDVYFPIIDSISEITVGPSATLASDTSDGSGFAVIVAWPFDVTLAAMEAAMEEISAAREDSAGVREKRKCARSSRGMEVARVTQARREA